MLALKRLSKHYGIAHADLLKRVLFYEQRRVISELTGSKVDAYHESVMA